jgi:DNA-directed RNA polymerase specialized sigma24 family protein
MAGSLKRLPLAEDVIQEAFLRAARYFDSFQG